MRLCNKHIKYCLSVLLMFTGISCEEFTEWDIKVDGTFITVDALITNELKQHKVYIYSSVSKLNDYPTPISGAIIRVGGNNHEMSFTENQLLPGEYVSDSAFSVAAGIEYQMTIEYGNHRDTATSHVVAITPLEPITIVPNEDYYQFVYQESTQPSMLEVQYDWSSQPEYCSTYGSCIASETYYSLNNLDLSKLFAPDKQQIIFPRGTTLILRKYSLNEEHQSFIRSLLMETEWRGGVFDLEPGNVPANFKHGTIGWFGTSMVITDTIDF